MRVSYSHTAKYQFYTKNQQKCNILFNRFTILWSTYLFFWRKVHKQQNSTFVWLSWLLGMSCTCFSAYDHTLLIAPDLKASVNLKDLANKVCSGLAGGGRWCIIWVLVLPACGVPLNHESNMFRVSCQSVDHCNFVSMKRPITACTFLYFTTLL
jgi:hypothetical protein